MTNPPIEWRLGHGCKLDYLKMLQEIDGFLETDWAFEMIDCKRLPDAKPYTQREAKEMADVLGQIYLVAHCIHCKACQGKFKMVK